MNIFLDSNAFYKDPFLSKGKNRVLLQLAEHDDVNLYINETVYMELFRAHKNFIDIELKAVNDAFGKLSPFLGDSQKFVFDVKFDELMDDFESRFEEFEENNQLQIIEYNSDVLENIVEIDMYNKPPFIKENKKAIRDAIIWYSYKLFIEENELEECYFISNNHKEFGALGSDKSPKEQPYSLHPEILGDLNITAYKTIHDFLTHNDDEIKMLYGEIISDTLLEEITEELEYGLAEKLILDNFKEQILSETQSYISNQDPEDLHHDYFMGGYVSPSMDGIISDIALNEIEIYGNYITVSIDFNVEIEVEIYLYNPGHDDRNDKYQYVATDTIKVEENAVFLIPINTGKELDTLNFSVTEYIKENEPCNLNVEFIKYDNIDHNDMFHDEDYEYEREL